MPSKPVNQSKVMILFFCRQRPFQPVTSHVEYLAYNDVRHISFRLGVEHPCSSTAANSDMPIPSQMKTKYSSRHGGYLCRI